MFTKTFTLGISAFFCYFYSKTERNNPQEDRFHSTWKSYIKIMRVLLPAIVFGFTPCQIWAKDDIRHSVVKIITTQRLPDMFKPWSKHSPRDIFATGVVIEGNRILTNAHAVAFAGQIYIQPYQSAEKIFARVIAKAPGIDLAVLELDDASFFKEHPPLTFADHLPKAKDTVNVYGYPVGGKELSITEGIVSRIEFAGIMGLRIQIDAALNPGNSGGPAMGDNKIIGLVSSKIKEAENTGYLIPVEEIKMFLNDIADGTYEGKPAFHRIELTFQTVENNALRDRLGIKKDISGIMVISVRNTNKDFPLKPWDLITHIGDHAVDNEGHVRVDDDLRLPMHYMVPHLAKEKKIDLTIIRKGKTKKIKVPVNAKPQRLVRFINNENPSYYIYGPLVFSPVTDLFLKTINPRSYQYLIYGGSPLISRRWDLAAFEDQEMVVLASRMFPHRITKGYDSRNLGIVSHVNGIEIKNLKHLIETLRDIKDEYVIFRFDDLISERLVFHRQEIEAATEDILNDNGIRYQCSEDLRNLFP